MQLTPIRHAASPAASSHPSSGVGRPHSPGRPAARDGGPNAPPARLLPWIRAELAAIADGSGDTGALEGLVIEACGDRSAARVQWLLDALDVPLTRDVVAAHPDRAVEIVLPQEMPLMIILARLLSARDAAPAAEGSPAAPAASSRRDDGAGPSAPPWGQAGAAVAGGARLAPAVTPAPAATPAPRPAPPAPRVILAPEATPAGPAPQLPDAARTPQREAPPATPVPHVPDAARTLQREAPPAGPMPRVPYAARVLRLETAPYSIALAADAVVCADISGVIRAYGAADGVRRWRRAGDAPARLVAQGDEVVTLREDAAGHYRAQALAVGSGELTGEYGVSNPMAPPASLWLGAGGTLTAVSDDALVEWHRSPPGAPGRVDQIGLPAGHLSVGDRVLSATSIPHEVVEIGHVDSPLMLRFAAPDAGVTALAVDAPYVAVGLASGEVHLLRVEGRLRSLTRCATLQVAQTGPVAHLALCAPWVAGADAAGRVALRRIEDGAGQERWLATDGEPLCGLALAPERLAAAGNSGLTLYSLA